MVFLEIFADLGYNYLHKMQSDLIEKFRWSLQTLNNSVNRTPVLKVVKQFFFFFCFWNEGWMTLHYVISVHTKFLLLGFSCLWVCGLEECFWLDRKACCTATKLKSSSLVTAVLAACCCFLVIFDSSRTLRSLCPFCSLDVFSLGGFPKLFPSVVQAFC